jgi:hypothetical protein
MIRAHKKCPRCGDGTMKPVEDGAEARRRALCTVCNYEQRAEDIELTGVARPRPALGSVSLWYSNSCLDSHEM